MDVVPDSALTYGFADGIECPHTSRTITVPDLRRLLQHAQVTAGHEEYREAVVDQNVLQKNTLSSRQKSFRYLREFFALSPDVLLFRALRDLWDADEAAQPLLALLCAIARDPVLRATSDFLLSVAPGHQITSGELSRSVEEGFPERFSQDVAGRIGRNIASSWQQSGHLDGFKTKTRAQATCRPAAATYALLLGYLCGARGDGLFDTLWCRLLDVPASTVRSQAQTAGQAGWLDYRHAGQVTEITFNYLMREEDGT